MECVSDALCDIQSLLDILKKLWINCFVLQILKGVFSSVSKEPGSGLLLSAVWVTREELFFCLVIDSPQSGSSWASGSGKRG